MKGMHFLVLYGIMWKVILLLSGGCLTNYNLRQSISFLNLFLFNRYPADKMSSVECLVCNNFKVLQSRSELLQILPEFQTAWILMRPQVTYSLTQIQAVCIWHFEWLITHPMWATYCCYKQYALDCAMIFLDANKRRSRSVSTLLAEAFKGV